MSRKAIDLTGQKFGRLTVIKRAPNNKWKQIMWYCYCDCGNRKIICSNSLRSGCTKSCGCLQKEIAKNMQKKFHLPFGIASFRRLLYDYKSKAKKRGYNFELTEKQFKKITKQPCYYCGNIPQQISHQRQANGAYIYNGIDRIDGTKGYTIDNVVSCCKQCNYAKRSLSLRKYRNWIKKSYDKMFGGINERIL